MPNAYKVVKHVVLTEPTKVKQCIQLSNEGNVIAFKEIDALDIVEICGVTCYVHKCETGKRFRLTEPITGFTVLGNGFVDRKKGFNTISEMMKHVDELVYNSFCRHKWQMEKRIADTMKLRENAIKQHSLPIPLHVLSLLVWGS